jgi:ubiquinone/menaquinone biosynthesis C-methylase UbiE
MAGALSRRHCAAFTLYQAYEEDRMRAKDNQPDWDKIAEKFDILLPQIAPGGEALLEALDARPGDRVLDLASGTGEPALTLARRQPHVHITGIDAAAGMVRAAQKKVAVERLSNISFTAMPAEQIAYGDNAFDKVLCRFGVMLFQDPLQGCREMHRVLKPGGRFALAVWSTPETMTTMNWAMQAFKDRVPEEHQPPLAKVTSLGHPGILDELFTRAGFTEFQITPRRFDYQFASFEEYWNAMEASDILKQQFDALPAAERGTIRDEIARFARDFQTDHGLVIPHEYLLAAGVK